MRRDRYPHSYKSNKIDLVLLVRDAVIISEQVGKIVIIIMRKVENS